MMRHADIKTTQRYYITQKVQRDAERIRDILGGAEKEPQKQRLRVVG